MNYKLYAIPGWGSVLVETQLAWYGLPYEIVEVNDLFKSTEARQRVGEVNPPRAGSDTRAARRHHHDGKRSDNAASRRRQRQRRTCTACWRSDKTEVLALVDLPRRQYLSNLYFCGRSVALRARRECARGVPQQR